MSDYQTIVEKIMSSRRFGIELGLSKTRELLDRCGTPDKSFNVYQVAGTNGKGSTTLMLARLLENAGHRVGVFTSPHLERFTERFVVNGQEANQDDIVFAYSKVADAMKEPLTFFEWSVCMALVHFEAKGCERVLLEVGLGGRLDATTAAHREGVVITGVDFDHQEYLGDTLEAIAKEKAAVAMKGKPVLIGLSGKNEARAVIERECKRAGATPLRLLSNNETSHLPLEWGQSRRENAACALAAFRLFGYDISDRLALDVLGKTLLPGRLERIERGRQWFVLDGAHNLGAVENLVKSVNGFDAVIVGINGDKNAKDMLKALLPLSTTWLTTASNSERALAPGVLNDMIFDLDKTKSLESYKSVGLAIEAARDMKRVLVCGSLYLVGEARSLLNSKC